MNPLAHEEREIRKLLGGKAVRNVRRQRPDELLVEFADGTRLFVDGKFEALEISVTGSAK